MKVLVTGATGFVGSYVVQSLIRQGLEVIATSVSADKAIASPWYNDVKYIPFDLAQFDSSIDYYKFFDEPDLMVHLAWEGLPNYKADFHETVNLPRHTAFLSNMIKYGLKDLTVTGTCLEYGMQEGCLKEDMRAIPENAYAKAKNNLRIALVELQHECSFLFKWVRLFYMYGKGQHPNSLLSQLERALENGDASFNMSAGEQVRDYLPVETVAENIVKIAIQKAEQGIINNCSGVPISIKQLVSEYLAEKRKHITLNFGFYPYPDYEPMHFWGNRAKLNLILNPL